MNNYHFGVVVDFKKVKANAKWGVVPFRVLASEKVEVLIISTRQKNWSFPKGNLMKDIGPRRTALLEAYEEAGIDGNLHLGANPMHHRSNLCLFFSDGSDKVI